LTKKRNKCLTLLSADVSRANKIVTDLLNFSRIKNLNKATTKIDELINGFLDNMDFGQEIRITRELEKVEANIDPDKLKQALVTIFQTRGTLCPTAEK